MATWPRRATYEHFVRYTQPYFAISTTIDITRLLHRAGALKPFSLVYLFYAMQASNEIEPFRYRRRTAGVLIHERIGAGSVIPVGNEQLDFMELPYCASLEEFLVLGRAEMARLEAKEEPRMIPTANYDALVFHSVLPWISFTGVMHAHDQPYDGVPRVVFGKWFTESDRTLMPIGVEVDHAMMDGLHVGRYLDRLQQLFDSGDLT